MIDLCDKCRDTWKIICFMSAIFIVGAVMIALIEEPKGEGSKQYNELNQAFINLYYECQRACIANGPLIYNQTSCIVNLSR